MKHATFWLMLCPIISFGCSSQQYRLQSDDDQKREDVASVRTVGDVSAVLGMQEKELVGIGIVRGLPGTGGKVEPGELRYAAIHDLKQHGVDDPKEFLASPDTTVVVVRATLPPAARDGDLIDIDVELPERDRAPSLRGAYLLECNLRDYKDKQELSSKQGQRGTLKGTIWARAKGPILVGMGDKTDKGRMRRGRIWSGARVLADNPLALTINKEAERDMGRDARRVASRINETFHGTYRGDVRGMAEAKTTKLVSIRVPAQYQHNVYRYLQVVRKIPLRNSPGERARYLEELGEDLLDPSRTVVAALKLEALGPDSVDTLKRGLESPQPVVRFSAAETLAYLSEPAGAETLAELIREHPRLRAYALAALASLDSGVSHIKLRELLGSNSAETAFGAFRALRALNNTDEAIAGQLLNDRFHLHHVHTDGTPFVHVSTMKRMEIVLFGAEHTLQPPFSVQAGPEFVITANDGDEECVISRISVQDGHARDVCSLSVKDIIQKMAALGATYPDAVDFLRETADQRSLSCRLAVDALPQKTSVYDLAVAGFKDKAASEEEDKDGPAFDLGRVPNLFAPGRKMARK